MHRTLLAAAGLVVAVQEVAAGSCTSDDLNKINALPKDTSSNSFGSKSNDCGHKAYEILSGKFDHDKFNACMASSVGISSACSECFAAAGEYGAEKCKAACLLGWCKEGCLQCTSSAQQTAATCSGVPTQKVTPCMSGVHPERQQQIEEIQQMEHVHWTAGAHARFASEAPGASKSLCGVKGSWKQALQEAVLRGEVREFKHDPLLAVPLDFDSEKNWPKCAKIIGDIRDQSNCGCCWAFAGAEAASDRMCIATDAKIMLPLSAQDVCFCSSFNGCGGGMIDTPWSFIKHRGAVTGGQYNGTGPFGQGMCSDFSLPHCHHHGPQGKDPYPAEGQPGCPSERSPRCPSTCDASASGEHKNFQDDKFSFQGEIETASGEAQIQQMIMKGGPVETAFTVYSDFENYVSGVYHHVSGGMAGGHAVKFVGWGVDNGVKYWKVANSWNPYWGEEGYFRIVRGSNEGGIEDQVIGSSASAKWGKQSGESLLVV
eukprot:CAMPEP_0206461534 /NCGR_PEP_ID=MMETSP0324_2-20121206/25425_1 /ASSEMBLY_ACC=CAM_ASM_000836 /TAXON_ID=2866 /ORGANISM="Crypthecodinium cohnii, Strain Seligo" /LENGTH=485 /DNA_ID=CAMNT_0053933487 /DNA_START=59 /DNA_END=1516 /DNA_ORIENTATION=-